MNSKIVLYEMINANQRVLKILAGQYIFLLSDRQTHANQYTLFFQGGLKPDPIIFMHIVLMHCS